MPGDEAQKNVGDCRTSLLGTRSKGKALHESATNPKNKLPPGTATRFCGGVRYSVGQREGLLREVQAAEEGVEAGVGASPLSVPVRGYSLAEFVGPVEDEVDVGDLDGFLPAFELFDQKAAASGFRIIGRFERSATRYLNLQETAGFFRLEIIAADAHRDRH